MGTPVYSHDLSDIALGVLGTELWDESSNAAYDDAGSMVDDINLQYNGNSCVSAQFTKDGMGSIINADAGGITVPLDGAVLVHHLWAAPRALDTYANGGVRGLIGTSYGDFKVYFSSGSDRAPSPKGGWTQYAIDPAQTSAIADVGSPGTSYTHIGIAVKATAQARGNPNACNAIRFGRCEVVFTAGEIADPANYAGFATIDNADAAKLGLLEELEKGYKQRGLQSFGTDTTAVYFKDSNNSIQLSDEPNVSSNFHRWEVTHADTVQIWESMNISALGTNAKGNYEMITDTATVEHTDTTLEDLGTFKYGSGATITRTIHRRCEPVSQLGATMADGTIDKPFNTIGMYVTNLNLVTGYTFNSVGTGYAADLGTISTDTSKVWDNTDNGYAATNGSTGNETLLVNVEAGFTLTITIATGASTPTYHNTGAGSVSIVTGQSSLKFTLTPSLIDYEWRIYKVPNVGTLTGAVYTGSGEENATTDNQTFSYSHNSGDIYAVQIFALGYEESVSYYPSSAIDQDVGITLEVEENI